MRSFGLFVVAVLTAVLFAYPATANAASVVATINGGGTANMDDGMGVSTFGMGVKLLSNHSAVGHFDCVDHHGDAPGYAGNIFGEVTSWEGDLDGGPVTLHITGKFVSIPGGLVDRNAQFTVTIQQFGGAGVGHWTLSVPDGAGGEFTVCFETLLSGQIVMRRS